LLIKRGEIKQENACLKIFTEAKHNGGYKQGGLRHNSAVPLHPRLNVIGTPWQYGMTEVNKFLIGKKREKIMVNLLLDSWARGKTLLKDS